MTLKTLYSGNPMDIPCVETSDAGRLCRHPVVSVIMMAYNHERYIRQAIKSVIAQKTDFEFELVIGEDCSQDATRTICFEYQKKYPETVRVLWADVNVWKLGGNGSRCMARCRGEYIAFCEGDDYWTDVNKLQKQIDLMRRTNAIGCVAWNEILELDGSLTQNTYAGGSDLSKYDVYHHYFHTSTYVLRRLSYLEMRKTYSKITAWYDAQLLVCMACVGKICLLPESVSVYRKNMGSSFTPLSSAEKRLAVAKMYMVLFDHGPQEMHSAFGTSVVGQLVGLANPCFDGYDEEYWSLHRKDIVDALLHVVFNMRPSVKCWRLLLSTAFSRIFRKQ